MVRVSVASTTLYAAGPAAGPITLTPTLTLSVPSKANSGSYSSTWTLTLASGP